jgi:serine/threonine protein kinase/molecular chaperone DnaK (HSP70)
VSLTPPSNDPAKSENDSAGSDFDFASIPVEADGQNDDGSWGDDTRGFDSRGPQDGPSRGDQDESWANDDAFGLADEIPTRVGEYRVQRLIGSGGMGRVYLAEHEKMQRIVALKTLPPQRMQQDSAVERFYAEVRAAARLLHPNIVTAFDAGNAGGIHYLAMEYVDGPTLTALVAKAGPLSIADAVSAIRDCARGLAHAHAAGIVHRDVKPSNLMRASDGTVKVVDLGLASVGRNSLSNVAAKERETGKLVGTIAFMSPEQLENPDAVDARSDIYSLGATFYFLLTGHPPYEGDFLTQVRGHRHDPLPELFAVRPDADLRLEHVLHRMMAKRPQDRYGSLVEVIADLAIHDTSESIPAWITGISANQSPVESSTIHGLSTRGEVPKVMAIDWGMFYATCAVAEPSGNVELLLPGGNGKPQSRIAVADGDPPIFGDAAAAQREQRPGTVIHCLPLFIGQTRMEHVIAGRRCPAEVLMAMQLRHLTHIAWPERGLPRAVAITVPSCYDQLHRQAILQAASIAGIKSVRLVDRSLAALQSWHLDSAQRHIDAKSAEIKSGDSGIMASSQAVNERLDRDPMQLSSDDAARPQMIISISGNATEVVIARRRGPRALQMATVGQWHSGILQWQQKLVDMAGMACRQKFGIDPLHSLEFASAMQFACERALTRFLLSETATISIPHEGNRVEFPLERDAWLDACEPLIVELLEMITGALERADVDPSRIRHCLLFGMPTRFAATRKRIIDILGRGVTWVPIDRTDIARGAAACVAGELPGRGDIPLPPQPSTCHDLGLLVIDAKGRRRIRTMIPRGTLIPARTSRPIAAGNISKHSLALVESSTWRETSWRSLGTHRIATDPSNPNLELTFEVDMDGELVIRRRDPQTGIIERLPPRPQPAFDAEELAQWTEWVAELLPTPKRSTRAT